MSSTERDRAELQKYSDPFESIEPKKKKMPTLRTLPYTGTEGHENMTYCQLDDRELGTTKDLMDHANTLILDLQKKLDFVTLCTCWKTYCHQLQKCQGCVNAAHLKELEA